MVCVTYGSIAAITRTSCPRSCKTYMLYNAYKAALPDWLRDRTAAYTFWSLLLLLLMLPDAVDLAVAVAVDFKGLWNLWVPQILLERRMLRRPTLS